MKGTILTILGILLSVVIAIFALQNNNYVEINYLFGKGQVLIPLLIFSLVAFGAAITLLFSIPNWWKNRTAKSALKKENKKLIDELARLREELLHQQQNVTQPKATEFYTDKQ